jgi:[ribosomal protein S18]-alanine N-acetyltransferase
LKKPKRRAWAVLSIASRYNGGVPPTSQDFKIRDAEPADFDTLWRIDQHCFPPGISYSRAELRAYMGRRGAFTLVAEGAAEMTGPSFELRKMQSSIPTVGTLAGFIVAEAHRRAGHIITIDVVAAARRHGLGSLLLLRAEKRMCTMGSESIELETAVDNLAALRFYKKHDYSVVGTLPHYYSNGLDALELRKRLRPADATPQK